MTAEDDVARALSIGEVAWALACADGAIKAARKAGGEPLLLALRRRAEVHLAHADDEDRADSARAAGAWRKVTDHEDATADDLEELAWAELLASATKKAKAALDEALTREPERSREVLQAAIAWSARRKDAKRRDTLVEAAASSPDVSRLERAVRLLVQAHACPVELADRLAASATDDEAVWDPRHARRVRLRVAAYRAADRRDRADELLAAWVRACEAALPDPQDERRHVLDHLGAGEPVGRMLRRVERVRARFGATSRAMGPPLTALASTARTAGAHDVAVVALGELDGILEASGSSQAVLRERLFFLEQLQESLIRLGRLDEALEVVERIESLRARIPGQLVPHHYGRARIYEARGDWDRALEEHHAAVAQYEAAYGEDGSNSVLARGWARQAYERAGRADEGRQRFPR